MMKYLAGISIFLLFFSCQSKKQAQSSEVNANKEGIKIIEISRQRTYPGQKNDDLRFIEHWNIVVEGKDVANKEMFLQIGDHEISLKDKIDPKLVIGSDSKVQNIEFDLNYPLNSETNIKEGDDTFLIINFKDGKHILLLENIIDLEPVILPSSQD